MSLDDDLIASRKSGWRGAWFVTATAAIVFAGLVLLNALAIGYAVAGFALVTAAAFLAMRAGEEAGRLARPVAVSERAGDPLEAVVAGLPDPAIALDRNGRVLALNERARSLAPALRRGELVSLALRMPELNEAIGRAYARGEEQRRRICRARAARPLVRGDRDAGQARAEFEQARSGADGVS